MQHNTAMQKKGQGNNRKKRNLGSNKRVTKGYIDSINLSYSGILTLFLRKRDRYIVERIDINNNAHRAKWQKLFGKSIFNKTKRGMVCPYAELYIVECPQMGITLPLKVSVAKKGNFILEFAGLRRYNEKSERLKILFWDLCDEMQDFKINRIDVAIDLLNRMPSKVHHALARVNRFPKKFGNTTYYKTPNEKKRNSVVNILMYPKGEKEGFSPEKKIIRLEYQLSSKYVNKFCLRDIDKALAKIEKRIKRDTTLNVKVCDDLV